MASTKSNKSKSKASTPPKKKKVPAKKRPARKSARKTPAKKAGPRKSRKGVGGGGPGPSKEARARGVAKAAKTNTGKPRAVTPDLYASMFEAYMEKPSARFVAKECGVDWSTAQKVIERGYPDYAMPPLRDRYRVAMAEANKKAEYAIADANVQSLTLIRAYKAKLAGRISTMKAKELPAALGGELDRMVRLESFLLGGADARPDLTGAVGSGVYAGMSYDQRLSFLKSGRLPVEGLPDAVDFNYDADGGDDGQAAPGEEE